MDSKILTDEFYAELSNEFRTTLVPMLGYSDLLSENFVENETGKLITAMKANILRVIEVLDQIDYVAGIECSRKIINTRTIVFNELINELVDEFKPGLEKKDLYIRIHHGGTIYIDTDYNLLRIVLQNVLESTVKYTDKGGITIEYRTISHSNRLYLKIKITDTGMGISDMNMDKMFESIRKENKEVNKDYKKSGLKLTITKKIIEKLDGELIIESQLGKGSVCLIELPLGRGVNG